jgi:hypothetical protein
MSNDDGDEDFNYDSEYKSKCTGLGALLGAIRNQGRDSPIVKHYSSI